MRWLGAILAVAVVATYANSLSAPFVLDDQASIVQNRQIRDLKELGDVLAPVADSPVAGRPIVNLSLALNYAAGGLDVRGYRVVNAGLHLVCAWLAFAVARHRIAPLMAFAAVLLWAVHPLNSEVVDYVSQRTESMMAAFYLLTLYAAIRAFDAKRPGRWTLVALASCWLGALCKESIVTAPIMVAVYDRVFLFDSWKSAFARRKGLYAGLAATWLLVAAGVTSGARAAVAGFSSGVSPWIYLLNQGPIITEYLRLSLWPDRLVAFYGWPQPVALADVAPYVALVGLLGVATIWAFFRAPAIGFLGAWFFITLAPTSSIVPVATEVGAERRMYLPLLAVMTLVVMSAAAIRRRLTTRRATLAVGSTLLLASTVALSATTIKRNREYQSELTLAQTIVERRPSPVALHMLGEQLLHSNRTDEGVRHLRESVAKGNSRAAYLLGITLYNQRRYAEAIEQLEAFIKTSQLPYRLVPRWLEPNPMEIVISRVALGRAQIARQQWAAATEQGTRALEIAPGHPQALLLVADAAFGDQRWDVSAARYREYLQRQPSDSRVLINYGITQVATEQLDEAIAAFSRAAEVDPKNARARELLALAQADRARLAR